MFQIIKNFGPGGLATDPFEENASPVQWTQMASVDLIAGDLVSPGQDITFKGDCPVVPKWMFTYSIYFTDYLFVSDGAEVWATSGGAWSRMAYGWRGGLVTYTVFLGSLVVNSDTDGPWYWPGTSTLAAVVNPHAFDPLVALPGWFTGATCLKMIAYKNFLVAIAVSDPARSPSLEPYLVCWSDAAPAGGLPGEWLPSPTNLAGDLLAQDTSGSLSAAEVMRDDLVLYKNDGQAYRMTYVGGALVMQLQRLYQGFGVPYPYSVASFAGLHYLTTRSGMTAFDGQSMQEIDFARLQEQVRNIFQGADGDMTYVCAYPGRKQIWIAYRLTSDEPFFGILKYDITQNCFTVHDYGGENLTAICAGRLGANFTPDDDSWNTGDNITWDDATGDTPGVPYDPWSRGVNVPLQDTMFLGLNSTTIARYDARGNPLHFDGAPKASKVTRYGIRLGDNSNRHLVRGIYPLAEGPGQLKITLGKSWAPWQFGSPVAVQWGQQRLFTPGVDRFIPVRELGDVFALEVINDDGLAWTLGGIGIEFEPLGHRG